MTHEYAVLVSWRVGSYDFGWTRRFSTRSQAEDALRTVMTDYVVPTGPIPDGAHDFVAEIAEIPVGPRRAS